ncbi:hypothetical protein [Lacipirellula sp.]|uniref:hypothetical protein n=1 Tax=Lacipirellula sp. TaxID=2691419 RepID=UPI003D132EFC
MPKMLLPNDAWLKANGYSELVKARKDRPEPFLIPQEPDFITERAILARINRKLAAEYEKVGINRGGHARYHHKDAYRNVLLGEFDDLESFARECGVMTANERIGRTYEPAGDSRGPLSP